MRDYTLLSESGENLTLPAKFFYLTCNVVPFSATNQPNNSQNVADKNKTTAESEFLAVLDAHQGIVSKVCRMYARTGEEQRDLFQDIVLQLWQSWPSFRHDSKVSTWMYRVALNVAISRLRRRSVPTTEWSEARHEMPEPEPSDATGRLYAALDKLSKVEKSLALLLLEDYSYEEITEITGLKAAHLRVKAHRLREKLRHLIQQQPAL